MTEPAQTLSAKSYDELHRDHIALGKRMAEIEGEIKQRGFKASDFVQPLTEY